VLTEQLTGQWSNLFCKKLLLPAGCAAAAAVGGWVGGWVGAAAAVGGLVGGARLPVAQW
jgi:hypothetical protein